MSYIAEMDTGKYVFTVVEDTEEAARKSIERSWRVWCEGIQGLDPDLDIYEWFSVRVFPFKKGRVYVDGEPLGVV